MATIKSYTDIEQSKKLAEILPIESADMYFEPAVGFCTEPSEIRVGNIKYAHPKSVPCWSLGALLGLIPKRINDYNVLRIDISVNVFVIWYDEIGYGVNNDLPNITAKSAVDACYEMILKLHEQNIL